MKYKILILFALLFVLTGCASNARDIEARNLSNTKSNGVIEVQENKINLGDISMKDGKVDIEFSLKNTSAEPVVIIEGETSCICTVAVVKTKTHSVEEGDKQITSRELAMPHGVAGPTPVYQIIEPGDEAIVIATFDPNAHGPAGTGPVKRDIFINTNSILSSKIDLSFFAEVIK